MASSDIEIEIYKQHRSAQDKQTYFLLAAVGACIGFAATQTKGMQLTTLQAPLGAAVLFWALSFWAGCMHVNRGLSMLYANIGLVKLQDGRDPLAGRDPQRMAWGEEAFREIVERHNKVANAAAHWQFRFLVLGVVCYLAWHILEMWSRS